MTWTEVGGRVGSEGPGGYAVSGLPEGALACPDVCVPCAPRTVNGFLNGGEICAWLPRAQRPAGGRLSAVDTVVVNGVVLPGLDVLADDADGALFDALAAAGPAGRFSVSRGANGAHVLRGWPGAGVTVQVRGAGGIVTGLRAGAATCPGPDCGLCLGCDGACVDGDMCTAAVGAQVVTGVLDQWSRLILNGRWVSGLSVMDGDGDGALLRAFWAIAPTTGVDATLAPGGHLRLRARPGRALIAYPGNVQTMLVTGLPAWLPAVTPNWAPFSASACEP